MNEFPILDLRFAIYDFLAADMREPATWCNADTRFAFSNLASMINSIH